MKPVFIAHARTIAKRKAQAFGVMLPCFLGLGAAGVRLLFPDMDLFDHIVGLLLLSIAIVGTPWSLIGLLWSLGDMKID
tara:strand:- start:21 stop:257 length:237 start_codon:yes stop_codon:yes gene_type:complete